MCYYSSSESSERDQDSRKPDENTTLSIIKIKVKENQKTLAYSKVYALQKFQVAFKIIFCQISARGIHARKAAIRK